MARVSSIANTLYTASATFDQTGNVKTRGLLINAPPGGSATSYTESFSYDGLNRLTNSTVTSGSGGESAGYIYDGHGNLKQKGALFIGTYADSHRPCVQATTAAGAVCPTGPAANKYNYNADGTLLSSPNHEARWNSFGAVASVRALSTQNNATQNARLEWRYDSARQRYLEQSYSGANSNAAGSGTLVKTTVFLGAFEEVTEGGITTWRQAIGSPDGPTAMITVKSNAPTTQTTRYWHLDHLGSVVAISDGTNSTAGLKQAFKYGPWGNRIVLYTAAGEQSEERGYTGHETLTEIGLVHMNGRLYDPTLGRFLSADPIIQDMYQSTSLNRYAYVMNNPMSYTDPSGFSAWTKFRDRWLKPIIAIAVSIFTYGAVNAWMLAAGYGGFISAVVAGAAAGFAAGGITTGSLRGALRGALGGALMAGLMYGLGQLIPPDATGLAEAANLGANSASDTFNELARNANEYGEAVTRNPWGGSFRNMSEVPSITPAVQQIETLTITHCTLSCEMRNLWELTKHWADRAWKGLDALPAGAAIGGSIRLAKGAKTVAGTAQAAAHVATPTNQSVTLSCGKTCGTHGYSIDEGISKSGLGRRQILHDFR
jgi:RHS repeat-associated protein